MHPPLYLRLADSLETLIARRSLRSGDRIPSVRQFSLEQRVSVPTALNAYAALESRGLIEARPKSGYFVRARQLDLVPEPEPGPGRPRLSKLSNLDPCEALTSDQGNPDFVQLGSAVSDPELLPGAKLARILSSVARRLGAAGASYDGGAGSPLLRREISRRLLSAGCTLGPDDLIVTTGAIEALALALRATCRPGDTVAFEAPTFFGFLRLIHDLGFKALALPVDPSNGMDLDVLARALRHTKIAACLTIPTFNNPTGFVMPDDRRRELLRLAGSHGFYVIEDDIYGDLPHHGPRPHCLKALDRDGLVILCSSFSKTIAPGYRVGYLAAGALTERALVLKRSSTGSSVRLTAAAIAEYMHSGAYDRFLRQFRECCRRQVTQMREAIAQTFPEGVRLSRPQGGFLLWCELPPQVDSLELFHQARAAGISLAPGALFSGDDPEERGRPGRSARGRGAFSHFIRINCGYPWSPRLERAVGLVGHLARTLAERKAS
jgi:DNA-binding transcriptional MocR family regulator